MLKIILRSILIVIGVFAFVATMLPLLPSNEAWIRIFDFPRLQIAALLSLVIIGLLPLLQIRRRRSVVLLVAVTAAFAYQIWRIIPYTPLHGAEALQDRICADKSQVTLLSANVLQENRQAQRLLDLIGQVRPDMVLLLETNECWDRHLAPLDADYGYALRKPQDNTYGIHLFSKLKLIDPDIRFLIEDYVPSIETQVELRSGAIIDFHGVHPKPPPLQDTEQRDAELMIVARNVREQAKPAIVAGDLNDVAWSRTTRSFQEISGLLDPRIGRGLYPTFNANWPLLKWPLDHVFSKPLSR
jgi:endonuclease/exonuclease/phosphatase (EEP) superfamily protein YafD